MSVRKKGQAAFARWMGLPPDSLRAVGGPARLAELSSGISPEPKLPAEVVDAAPKPAANRSHNRVRRARRYVVRVDRAFLGAFRRQGA